MRSIVRFVLMVLTLLAVLNLVHIVGARSAVRNRSGAASCAAR
jgi:hypothetical protein